MVATAANGQTVGTIEVPPPGTPTPGANELVLQVPVEIRAMQRDTRAFQVVCALGGPGVPNAVGRTVQSLGPGQGSHVAAVEVIARTDWPVAAYESAECRLYFCAEEAGPASGALCDTPVPDQPGPLEPELAHRYYQVAELYRGEVQFAVPDS